MSQTSVQKACAGCGGRFEEKGVAFSPPERKQANGSDLLRSNGSILNSDWCQSRALASSGDVTSSEEQSCFLASFLPVSIVLFHSLSLSLSSSLSSLA
ncbi:unnamed protein product [Protopolystoma xenopodis]|uniref:Uncharacterized protein n=1 Tax=Protopolystoma xenopodis TaxID=117903 RepID=A0A3S5CV36_9PLAT|nr:unnamed protein product [Protopolystoma xenopodis]